MRALVTGGAGFVGSHLVDRLLADGHAVTVYDDLSTGRPEFLAGARRHPAYRFVEGDVLDGDPLTAALEGHDIVFHLAANADVRFGLEHPRRDLEQNTLGTFTVLEAMRARGVRRIAFTSTASVYGEPAVFPTPETCPFPVQTSLYAASKVAAEGLISAYAEGYGLQAWIFRLVSVLGERYTHGHVFDFYAGLLRDPTAIDVLGDGRQRKSYVYVDDGIDGIVTAVEQGRDRVNVFNVGTDEHCSVDESLSWIAGHLGLTPARRYAGGTRGWVGDSPFIFVDASRLRGLGWRPTLTIREAVIRTLDYLRAHPALLALPSRR
ncbi:MAG: NAD-dependent epimerase/dehydratase family protein [Candidatus Rokubacteria bacterium]|nr:NAD-dependent epimerase/dehydratase family protein [Candidatus Rokubacteria bacterium]